MMLASDPTTWPDVAMVAVIVLGGAIGIWAVTRR